MPGKLAKPGGETRMQSYLLRVLPVMETPIQRAVHSHPQILFTALWTTFAKALLTQHSSGLQQAVQFLTNDHFAAY